MTKSRQGIERFRFGPSHPSLGKISSSILYEVHLLHVHVSFIWMTKSQLGNKQNQIWAFPSLPWEVFWQHYYEVYWVHRKTRMGPPIPSFGRNMVVFLRSFLDSPEDADVLDSIEVTLASVGAATI